MACYFHVVEFLNEATEGKKGPVAVIPDSWLLKDEEGNDSCHWPPSTVKIDEGSLIRNKPPNSSWPKHIIKIHVSRSDYRKAVAACNKLTEQSEISSQSENDNAKRRRVIPSRYRIPDLSSSSDEDLNEISAPPFEKQPSATTSVANSPTSIFNPRFPQVPPKRPNRQIASPVAVSFTSTGNHSPISSTGFSQRISVERLCVLLEEVKVELRTLHMKVDRLMVTNQDKSERNTVLPEGFNFPLKTIEEVLSLDLLLGENREKRQSMIRHLGTVGGRDIKTCVRAILTVIFSTVLARQYNYHGMKGKNSMRDHLHILKTIHAGVRQHFVNATELEMKEFISSWLSGARDRENGKKEREEKRKTFENEEFTF